VANTIIYLNLDQLKSGVITLNDKKIQQINQAMISAQNTIYKLTGSGWQGETKDVFIEKFAEYKKDLTDFNELLKDFNGRIKTVYSEGMRVIMQGSKIPSKL